MLTQRSVRQPRHRGACHRRTVSTCHAVPLLSEECHRRCRIAKEGHLWTEALLLARAHGGDRAFMEVAEAAAAARVAEGTPLSTLLHALSGCQQALLPAAGAASAGGGPPGETARRSGPSSGGGFSLGAFLSGAARQVTAAQHALTAHLHRIARARC